MGKGKRRKGGKSKAAPKKAGQEKATSVLDQASSNLKKAAVNDASGVLKHVSVTGVLDSRVDSRDVQISSFSIGLHGRRLIEDADLHLNHGRRYGLIGENGSGKSTMLKVIASGELPIPDHIDIYHLDTEAKPSDVTAMDAVMNIVKDRIEHLEKEMEELMEEDPESERKYDNHS